jgi:hypothetical protein
LNNILVSYLFSFEHKLHPETPTGNEISDGLEDILAMGRMYLQNE